MIVDYRLHPDVGFPHFVEDGAKAVAWVRRYIGKHGGDVEKIQLIGHSAGAHIAAMLALDPTFLAAEGMTIGQLNGLIGLAGPYDFLPIQDPTIKAIFGIDDLEATQPITHAGPNAPRTLLLTGEDDRTVLPRNSQNLGRAINQAGGEATVKAYAGIGHVGIILALAPPFRWLAPTLQDVLEFIEGVDQVRRRAA